MSVVELNWLSVLKLNDKEFDFFRIDIIVLGPMEFDNTCISDIESLSFIS